MMDHAPPALLILCALACGSLAEDKNKPEAGKSDPARGVNFYSVEKEIAMGKEMAQGIERQAHLLPDPVTSEFVNRLGQNLVRNSDSKLPFNIKVIDSDEVNAYALPGGFMYVNTGLIRRAQDEAELAAVMSHEIAHVAARHGTKQATRQAILNYASIPLVFMGGWAGFAIREAATFAVPLGSLQFSRSMEREADHLGLQYLNQAGYDPNAFVDFFERIESLEKSKPGTISKLFSTHPMTGSRIARAQKEIQRELKPRAEYLVDTSEFHEIRQRLDALGRRFAATSGNDRAPVLKRRSSTQIDPGGASSDERPTLQRHR